MKNSSVLTFTGDIGFDKYMKDKWNDASLLSEDVLSFIKNSDHVITNVEGPLYDGSSSDQSGRDAAATALMHCMDPGVCHFLSGIGSDIWNICNNHIMDAGVSGVESTLKIAAGCNAHTIGAGMNIEDASSPVIIQEAGGIGMIGVGYQRACRKADDDSAGCFSWSDAGRIRSRIAEIKKACRWCIVVAHAGEEFTALPSPYTRERYISFLEMGADIVVAHHPHVVNNYETIGNKAIFYSLGNFIFDTDYQRSQMYTEYGVLLKIRFTEETFSFEPLGIKIDRSSETVVSGDLLPIFTDVPAVAYEALKGLAARVLIENTKRQLRYMKPDEFANASEDDFVRNFYEPLRSGRVPGETLDMQIIYPLSLTYTGDLRVPAGMQLVADHMLSQISPFSKS